MVKQEECIFEKATFECIVSPATTSSSLQIPLFLIHFSGRCGRPLYYITV